MYKRQLLRRRRAVPTCSRMWCDMIQHIKTKGTSTVNGECDPDLSPGSTLSTHTRLTLDTVETVDTGVNRCQPTPPRHPLDTVDTADTQARHRGCSDVVNGVNSVRTLDTPTPSTPSTLSRHRRHRRHLDTPGLKHRSCGPRTQVQRSQDTGCLCTVVCLNTFA